MRRVYNFSSGPACLPEAVLKTAGEEMADWHTVGYSVMEMSHREKAFSSIYQAARDDLRELMAVPDSYDVLFLSGSASLQFSAIPLNLAREDQTVDFLVTGDWSKKAWQEAARLGKTHIAANTEEAGFHVLPDPGSWHLTPDAAYVHYCPNETIRGVEFSDIPDVGNVPLVADMSSMILSKAVDVSRFGLIFAGAQKNIGPAGLVVVIVRKDLLNGPRAQTPRLLDYTMLSEMDGLYNTPPTYAIYIAGLVFKWLKEQGGVAAMEAMNATKAEKLYRAIDESDLFYNTVAPSARSRMNVTFFMRRPELEAAFLAGAAERGLVQLRGHRTVGGLRASLYNAMPEAGVDALIRYMKAFETDNPFKRK